VLCEAGYAMANLINIAIEELILLGGGVLLLAFPDSFIKPDSSEYEKSRKKTIFRTIGLVMVVAGLIYAGIELTKPPRDAVGQQSAATLR
jgi:hypothetical protein